MARKFEFFGSYTSFQGLFDLYPNATLGFSLRKLSVNYNGNCIRVRRSSDNATLDVGFVNNVLDTASLLAFAGASSCFVTIWYNQATNNNAIQTTVVNQPRIVNNGVLDVKNGKPCLVFNGNQSLILSLNSNLDIVSKMYAYTVASVNGLSRTAGIVSYAYLDSGIGRYSMLQSNANALFLATTGVVYAPEIGLTNTSQKILTQFIRDTIDHRFGVNASSNSSALSGSMFPPTRSNVTFKIGSYSDASFDSPSLFHIGTIQEVVNYYNDQEVNRGAIQSNINSFYGIY